MRRMRVPWSLFCAALVLCSCACCAESGSVEIPAPGKLYHGVYPGGQTGAEDDITLTDLRSYEQTVGRRAAWVYFSNNWYAGREFPLATAQWIRDAGSIPFIRLMLRSSADQNKRERTFSLKAILKGTFDEDFKKWARQARDFASPLLVEWGTECNGRWFSWNGKWNGGRGRFLLDGKRVYAGPNRFVSVFRRIVTLMRGEGAANITWVFHIDCNDDPQTAWNRFENYYPGDDYVDWVAVSDYGPQQPADTEALPFDAQFDPCYQRLVALTTKPIVVAEFGCTAGSPAAQPDQWAGAALDALLSQRWPNIIGFSWWNERWENDNKPAHDTTMRVQDIPALADVFRTKLDSAGDAILPPKQ
jgi:hypothetical protein